MKDKHDDMVNSIRRSPHRVGIENHVASTGEVIFWRGGSYATSPDSLIFTRDRRVFVVEYKAHDKKRSKDRMQLRRHMKHTQDLFKYFEISGLYIHGSKLNNLEVEEI